MSGRAFDRGGRGDETFVSVDFTDEGVGGGSSANSCKEPESLGLNDGESGGLAVKTGFGEVEWILGLRASSASRVASQESEDEGSEHK